MDNISARWRGLGEDAGDPAEDAGATSFVASNVLLIWLSPQFPVGSFAYSHGLEWAIQAGFVHNLDTACDWVGTLLTRGSPRNDLIIAARAYYAANTRNFDELKEISSLALALAGCRERFLECSAQGNAFLAAIRSAWLTQSILDSCQAIEGDCAYPVAVAIASAGWHVDRSTMLHAYSLAWVQNLASAAIRLSVIGQSDGQRMIAKLLPMAAEVANMAVRSSLSDLGGAAFMSDIAAIRHETQTTRLFRS